MTSNLRYSAVVLLLAIQASLFAEDAVRWAPDLDTARRIAAEKNLLVYVHFDGDNCTYCRKLEANVFSQASFAEALERDFVPVKINGSQQPELAAQFGVDRWPQDVVITPGGKFVYRAISPQEQDRYESMLALVAAKVNPRPTSPAAAAPNVIVQNPGHGNMPPQGAIASQTTPQQPAMNNPSPSGSRYSSFGAAAPQPQQTAAQPSAPQPSPYGSPAPQMEMPSASRYANNDSVPSVSPMTPGMSPQSRFTSDTPLANMPAPPETTTPARPAAPQSSFAMQPSQPGLGAALASQQPSPTAPSMQPAPSPQPQAAPAGEPKFAMDGYCPVTLLEHWKWQKGDPRWGAQHQGQVYLFSSQTEQQKFLANPNQYSPVMSGIDPVAYLSKGQVIPGDRRFGMTYRGAVYLFSSEENLQAFYNDKQRFSNMVQQAMASRNMQR